MNKSFLCLTLSLSISIFIGSTTTAQAQGSDFFGSAGGAGNPASPPPGAAAAEQQLSTANATDLTQDEKRMQKKFKANLAAAQELIAKGDKMMKDGQKRKKEHEIKKGKIIKEIGEKRVAELKANSPIPELAK